MWSEARIPVEEAINMVRAKIANREGITDISGRRANWPRKIDPAANGFLVRVRGLGVVVAIKPGAICNWIPGDVSMLAVVRKIDMAGDLIHGCDGKRTRQVFIPGIGRYRYYCFKAGRFAQVFSRQTNFTRPALKLANRFAPRMKFDWTDED